MGISRPFPKLAISIVGANASNGISAETDTTGTDASTVIRATAGASEITLTLEVVGGVVGLKITGLPTANPVDVDHLWNNAGILTFGVPA